MLELVEFKRLVKLLEESQSGGFGGEISDMGAEDSAAISGDGKGGFLMATKGDNGVVLCGLSGCAEWQWKRGETAGQSDDGGLSGDNSDDAVIDGSEDCALMSEEEIGSMLEVLFGIGVRVQDGIIFDVCAGDDDGVIEVPEDEVMECSGGQEDSNGPEGVADIRGNW